MISLPTVPGIFHLELWEMVHLPLRLLQYSIRAPQITAWLTSCAQTGLGKACLASPRHLDQLFECRVQRPPSGQRGKAKRARRSCRAIIVQTRGCSVHLLYLEPVFNPGDLKERWRVEAKATTLESPKLHLMSELLCMRRKLNA